MNSDFFFLEKILSILTLTQKSNFGYQKDSKKNLKTFNSNKPVDSISRHKLFKIFARGQFSLGTENSIFAKINRELEKYFDANFSKRIKVHTSKCPPLPLQCLNLNKACYESEQNVTTFRLDLDNFSTLVAWNINKLWEREFIHLHCLYIYIYM